MRIRDPGSRQKRLDGFRGAVWIGEGDRRRNIMIGPKQERAVLIRDQCVRERPIDLVHQYDPLHSEGLGAGRQHRNSGCAQAIPNRLREFAEVAQRMRCPRKQDETLAQRLVQQDATAVLRSDRRLWDQSADQRFPHAFCVGDEKAGMKARRRLIFHLRHVIAGRRPDGEREKRGLRDES